ncbi:hypothetical protein CsSME_00049350 [Camellia sinensis var. sinensis]|uniref:Uncharacterized protein n=1 Tax=Camellia sinensis TaxID=4442 RepID=A0A7J7G4J8_CAMSI|nr:hypothetical protein HYC85_026802 [Camellia sinensis]
MMPKDPSMPMIIEYIFCALHTSKGEKNSFTAFLGSIHSTSDQFEGSHFSIPTKDLSIWPLVRIGVITSRFLVQLWAKPRLSLFAR